MTRKLSKRGLKRSNFALDHACMHQHHDAVAFCKFILIDVQAMLHAWSAIMHAP